MKFHKTNSGNKATNRGRAPHRGGYHGAHGDDKQTKPDVKFVRSNSRVTNTNFWTKEGLDFVGSAWTPGKSHSKRKRRNYRSINKKVLA